MKMQVIGRVQKPLPGSRHQQNVSDMVVIVFGLPGSGKSYFAQRLAETLGAAYVNSDRLRKEMFQVRKYSEEEKAMVYTAMLDAMENSIDKKENLVLDATFHVRASRDPFIRKGGGNIVFIEVQSDEATIRDRLKKTRPYSEADFDIYKMIKKGWEPMEKHHLKLQSTNDNIEAMLKEAHQYIRNVSGTD